MKYINSKFLKRLARFDFPFFASTQPRSSGFTIIELLVVLTLVGLVSGVGIFSLINYGNSQTIEQATREIKGIIDEAKFNSVSSVVLETSESGEEVNCSDDELIAYEVERSVDDFTLLMICEGGVENIVETYTLHDDLSIGSGTTCNSIRFESVNIHVSADPLLPCSIVIDGFSQSRVITIDVLGNIDVGSSS